MKRKRLAIACQIEENFNSGPIEDLSDLLEKVEKCYMPDDTVLKHLLNLFDSVSLSCPNYIQYEPSDENSRLFGFNIVTVICRNHDVILLKALIGRFGEKILNWTSSKKIHPLHALIEGIPQLIAHLGYETNEWFMEILRMIVSYNPRCVSYLDGFTYSWKISPLFRLMFHFSSHWYDVLSMDGDVAEFKETAEFEKESIGFLIENGASLFPCPFEKDSETACQWEVHNLLPNLLHPYLPHVLTSLCQEYVAEPWFQLLEKGSPCLSSVQISSMRLDIICAYLKEVIYNSADSYEFWETMLEEF